jgi:hypothetical protein
MRAIRLIILPPLGNCADRSDVATVGTIRGDAMSRWMQYRERYQQKRNAFLLLTLSGVIRSADVEVPYFRGTMAGGLGQAEHSIWSMDLRHLFSKVACRPNVAEMK